MNLVDAVICIGMASLIYGTDKAVRRAAKRALKKVPAAEKPYIAKIILSRSPLEAIRETFRRLEDGTKP